MTHPDMPADRTESAASADVESAAFDAELDALPVQDRVDVTVPPARLNLLNLQRVLTGAGYTLGPAHRDLPHRVHITAHLVGGYRLLVEAANVTTIAAIRTLVREQGWTTESSAATRMIWVSGQ